MSEFSGVSRSREEATAEGFFSIAKGPFAELFHSQLPNQYGWRSKLAVPRELTPELEEQWSKWVGDYVKRRQAEIKRGKPTPAKTPDFAPYADWATEIEKHWRDTQKRFTEIGQLSDEQRAQSAKLFEQQCRQLADYLAGESLDIQNYQHQLWRLKKAEAAPGADKIPYRKRRIEQKTADTTRLPYKWVGTVKQLDQEFTADLRSLLTAEQLDSSLASEVDTALQDSKTWRMGWLNVSVTCLILAVGICLLAGLFTRLAALGGALFLLTAMASQPPWVAGAITEYFPYQLVEFAALLLLAASSAGRWAGLDFILHRLWCSCCGKKKRNDSAH